MKTEKPQPTRHSAHSVHPSLSARSAQQEPPDPVAQPSFATLLYRYLFFSWLFKDASCGNLFERAAAWRHNQSQAHWLPTYMWRWCCFGLLLMSLGSIAELGLQAPVLSAFLYVSGAMSFPVNTVIGVAWLGLRHWQGP